MMKKVLAAAFCLWALSTAARTQATEFYPGADYDPAIPTLETVVGHAWGEKITSFHEMRSYIRALSEASPRVELREYGES